MNRLERVGLGGGRGRGVLQTALLQGQRLLIIIS